MSRHKSCDYCKKEARTNEMVKVVVNKVERILCVKCCCFMMADRLERMEKWLKYTNDFMIKQFPKNRPGNWDDIGKI